MKTAKNTKTFDENDIKTIRKSIGLTQKEAAMISGIPLRTYQNYEGERKLVGSIKYEHIVRKLKEYGFVSEDRGVLRLDTIKSDTGRIFEEAKCDFVYLIGDYAGKKPKPSSSVDFVISSELSGIRFFQLVDSLHDVLVKPVNVYSLEQVGKSTEILKDLLTKGIRIY